MRRDTMQENSWGLSYFSVLVQDKKGCKGGVTTNLDVTAVIRRTPHGDDCPVDEHTKKGHFKKGECGRTKDHPAIL
ncbi:hypothetical protein T07_8499 [Trichinella nelsoni]|uniref:Uncharacterized protein n=1 Tax=Trichinella nelsoni TaxID=6336 RepID=A0A0V0RWZ2_9BILA|nr:hypothetical protein T07_8499 [Trichinella nelsoni]